MDTQIKAQEVEIKTLLNCVENLRKQLVEQTGVDVGLKYTKYDKMIDEHKNAIETIEKIKKERTVEVQKDAFDLAMKKISKQAELEMIEIELNQLYTKYGAGIDLEKLGLKF